MKTTERRHLKTNEVASTIGDLMQQWESNRPRILVGAGIAVVVIAALGGFYAWRQSRTTQAQTLLAEAMSIASSPVASPAPPGSPQPPPVGSFATEQARSDAALAKFLALANTFNTTREGIAARYEAASLLAELGRIPEADREFRAVAEQAGTSVYGRMARLGLAEMQVRSGQFDQAIASYRELASKPDADMPVDGVLMQLARAYQLAGKTAEARQTFSRILEEYPQSLYAAEAKQGVEALGGPVTAKTS